MLVVLASYRITRFVADDEWPPIQTARDALERRWDLAWFSGLRCYWCLGTIVAGALVAGLAQTTDIANPAIVGAAAATGVGITARLVDG